MSPCDLCGKLIYSFHKIITLYTKVIGIMKKPLGHLYF